MAINWNKFDADRTERLPYNLQREAECGICDEHVRVEFYDSDLKESICSDCANLAFVAAKEMRKSVTHPDYGKGKQV